MNINFTKNEYRLFLDIAYLGQWMLQAYESDLSGEDDEYEMLVQKIYSFGNEMGCGDLVESSKKLNKFYPTRLYEDESGIHDKIDRYNEDTFWDELINRLAERDAHADAEASNQEISSVEDFLKLSAPHESRYAQEFSKNGLRNITISET
jgi:hypothetical protein